MRKLISIAAAPVVFLAMQAFASAETITSGTRIQVRTDQPIELHQWDKGRIFRARVAEDVRSRDGDVTIRRGSPVELIVRSTGPDMMALDLESVTVNGKRYAMDTQGPQFNMRDEEYRGGGGLLGSIVDAISGDQARVEHRGRTIQVPGNAMITFELREPLHVVEWADPGYERDQYHYHREGDWYR